MITKSLLGVVAALSAALLWFYIGNLQLQNDLQTAIIKQEAAETSLRTVETEKALAEKQIEQFQIKMVKIEQERDEAREQVTKMRNLFQDHNFARLLEKKPGLIENRMIKKTQEVFDEIEALTSD